MSLVAGFSLRIDSNGYRLESAVPAPKPLRLGAALAGKRDLLGQLAIPKGVGARIVRNGGNLRVLGPLEKFDNLYRQFAKNAGTIDGAFDFVSKFCLLTVGENNPKNYDDVENLIAHAGMMKSLLDLKTKQNTKRLVSIFNKSHQISTMNVSLVSDYESGKLSIQLDAPTLLAGLWIQLAQAIAGGDALKACGYCNQVFSSGPGTGRRLDAKFCCDEHRKHYNSEIRSVKK